VLVVAAAARSCEVDRLYVIDCGWAHAADQSLWSPGVNVGIPIDFSDNCYLIHHTGAGYLLWDTGITDRLAALPSGQLVQATGQTWHRSQTLVAALAPDPNPGGGLRPPWLPSPPMCATSPSRMSTPIMSATWTSSPRQPWSSRRRSGTMLSSCQ